MRGINDGYDAKEHMNPMSGRLRSVPFWVTLGYALAVLLSSVSMLGQRLSDDQITYWSIARTLLGFGTQEVLWNPTLNFSYLLAAVYPFTGNAEASFILIYAVTASLYLWAMHGLLKLFLQDDAVVFGITVISLAPFYTLGMTYWGFAGFEFVKARILIMPLVPLVLRLFFEGEQDGRRGAALVLMAAAGFFNFEAFLGLAILLLYLLPDFFSSQRSKDLKVQEFWAMTAALLLAGAIRFGNTLYSLGFGASQSRALPEVYDRISTVVRSSLVNLSDGAYNALHWEAAAEGFWWALWPPRISDVLFWGFNAFFVLLFALVGLMRMRVTHPDLFKIVVRFTACAVIVAYAHPFFRWIAWKAADWPPLILEETRAFKFVMFPVFLSAGFFLRTSIERRRWGFAAMAVFLMLISPLQLMRSLPDEQKQWISQKASDILGESRFEDYVLKALALHSMEQKGDLLNINRMLKEESRDQSVWVMSDLHALKFSGQNILVSYQDKRTGRLKAFVPSSDRTRELVEWYTAYREISQVIHSGNAEAVVHTAQKYGCTFVVAPNDLNHRALHTLYEGAKYSLYRI